MLARFACTCVLVTVARNAGAEGDPGKSPEAGNYAFRLSYEAPAGCPTAEAFSDAVTANSARAHRASPDEIATDIDALASVREGGFVGMLRIRRPDGTESSRSVPAPTCKETMSALAFIAAITIDPDAASPAAIDEVAPEAQSAPPPPPATVAAEIRRVPRDAAPRPREEQKDRPWTFGLNAGIGLASAIAPEVSPDFSAGVGFGATRRTLLSPLVLLAGHFATSPSTSNSEGTARFQRIAGRLTACPLRFDAAMVTIRPCALFELGQLRADGSDVSHQTSVPILWAAVGATMRGELPLAGPLNLALDLGALFPLVSDSFYFKPSHNSIYTIPAAGFVGVLGIGLRIL